MPRLPNFSKEKQLWKTGFRFVAGVDEVGRGAWAGPLYAAAVIFSPEIRLREKITDSKKVSSRQRRRELARYIKEQALAWAVSSIDIEIINSQGITVANEQAMMGAIGSLGLVPDFVLIDYFKLPSWPREKQLPLKHGDELSISIAAASILAKVARDEEMEKLAQKYQGYGFESHVGYGTKKHQANIKQFGLSEIHRLSFIPQ